MISQKLKEIIFKKLYKDLSHVEIITYGNDIWFIDRNDKYWFFKYDSTGRLWWRRIYFNNFFTLFSLTSTEFVPIISSWVEEVLNYKVNSAKQGGVVISYNKMEEVLNSSINNPPFEEDVKKFFEVDEVLKYKVKLTPSFIQDKQPEVENVLKHTVKSSLSNQWFLEDVAKDVLSYTVYNTRSWILTPDIITLNHIFDNETV
jgi:hypothetical protein